MTENKRFKLKEDCDWWGITDDTLPKTEYGYREDLSDEYIPCDYCWNDLTHQEVVDLLNNLYDENGRLKKELHLMHIRTMFSTVQSFKGDVSKRYKYSEETDSIYDTANNYGQYNKILDKAEIVMLLNEYETVLDELNGE